MGQTTAIQWTEASWNPIRGCSRVSEGCRHCYAEVMAARFGQRKGQPYYGVVTKGKWNGIVQFVPEHLRDPLKWKQPRMIFVNSMSDLFHEGVQDEWLEKIFDVMYKASHHTFQVLTKRPERMLTWCTQAKVRGLRLIDKPLDNVWLGVSVENQTTADERIPLLLQTPAAIRWVSYEPALGPVDFGLNRWICLRRPVVSSDAFVETRIEPGIHRAVKPYAEYTGLTVSGLQLSASVYECLPTLDYLVCGGESGPNARAFDFAWAASTISQGREAGAKVFIKQAGSNPFLHGQRLYLKDRKGGDPSEWLPEFRIRDW